MSAAAKQEPLGRWREVVVTSWDRSHDLELTGLASGAAFWLLLSVFPAGLVAVNVLGLFVSQDEVARQIGELAAEAPGTWGDLLGQQLLAVAAPTPGSGPYDILLVLVALWTVSTAMVALLRAVRRVYGLPRTGFLIIRSLAAGVAVTVIAVVALVAEVIDARTTTGTILGTAVTVVVLFALVLGILRVAVGGQVPWRDLAVGAGLGAVGLVLVGAALNLYANVATNLTLVYGNIAGLVVSMLTVWLGVYVVLLGAVVNTSLHDPQREGP